ncbi:MAG: bifunctional riboflavin kinase/FAD synthetase [Gammaproteobacteria bacterium]
MELIRGVHNLKPHHRGSVATVGNFDGVHRGHCAVLEQLKAAAVAMDMPTAVIMFEPQPSEYFSESEPPPRLSSMREKLMLLEAEGIDYVMVLRFNESLAAMTAGAFVKDVLVDGLGVRQLIIGDDFKFGSARGGDFFALQEFGRQYGFEVRRTLSYLYNNLRVSSTEVRQKLVEGNFVAAERLLGRRYFVAGRVVHGQARAKAMGYPTANLKLNRRRSPLEGIYATYVYGVGPKPLPSVTYVGSRPIIEDPTYVIEAHIFDFDQDIYGKAIKVEFIEKIRDDFPYESFEKLIAQMEIDCRDARRILASNPP